MIWLLGIRNALRKVPWQAWAAIALALVLWLGVRWYHGQINDAEKRGATAESARIAVKAQKLKKDMDALTGRISAALREKNNVEVRRITVAADDLRMRGPGAASASCPSVASGSSGRIPASRPGNSASTQVSASDGAIVPWNWLVGQGERCDLNRAEVLAWRDWREQVLKVWPK